MPSFQFKKILAENFSEDFLGRSRELEQLLNHAEDENAAGGILLLSAPGLGATELLLQAYDTLYYRQGDIIPFYFRLEGSDKSARAAALRFLQQFLQQVISFRRRDPKIFDAAPGICELSELTAPTDAGWIGPLIETCQSESELNDERSIIRSYLSAPLRAANNGARAFVMVDNLHEFANLPNYSIFFDELRNAFGRAKLPFVFAGRRRFLYKKFPGRVLSLEPLSFSDAGKLAEHLAKKYAVALNDQTRDLIAAQFQGNPAFIKFVFEAAAEKKAALDSFLFVEQIYLDEIFGGRIGKFYETILAGIDRETISRNDILRLFDDLLNAKNGRTSVETLIQPAGADFKRALALFNENELVRLTSNAVEPMLENEVLSDFIRSRYRLEITGENRALVVSDMLASFLKRAPQLMGRLYRSNSSVGLRQLMNAFNCQKIPLALIDYERFKSEYKGASDKEIAAKLASDESRIALPQIVYAANTVAFYKPISRIAESERSAVALGFEASNYTEDDEIVWIAAEIDSKLEASADLTEFWCDRLEMVALECNFKKYKLWLVAPEGFSAEALVTLSGRNVFGSSRRQVELLEKTLKAGKSVERAAAADEYEIIVPMGEDTELIAAQTVEEIAKRYNFPAKAINQIKTALVEACINAAEHSLSPDRKIYQKFAVIEDRMIITVSNRGLRLDQKGAVADESDEGRRGWGLKLIKGLMDDVRIERVDDGTRITMTKILQPE